MKALIKAMLIAAVSQLCLAKATSFLPSEPEAPKNSRGNKTSLHFSRSLENDLVRSLIGMRLENQDGRPMGNLEDFLVDLRSGQLMYALVSSGGFLGLHKEFRILPPELISSATSKRGVLELKVGNVRWQRAPRFAYGQLELVGNPELERRIYHYYQVQMQIRATPVQRTSASAARGRSNNASLQLATRLIGQPLASSQYGLVGTLSDFLVDLKGRKPVLAVISPNQSLNARSRFGVLLPRLRSRCIDRLSIDAPPRAFVQAPKLDEQSWLAAAQNSDAGVYRLAGHSQEAGETNQKMTPTGLEAGLTKTF